MKVTWTFGARNNLNCNKTVWFFLSRSLKQQFLVFWRAAVLRVVILHIWHLHYFIIQRILDCIFIVFVVQYCVLCVRKCLMNYNYLSWPPFWLLFFTSEVHLLIKMVLFFCFFCSMKSQIGILSISSLANSLQQRNG